MDRAEEVHRPLVIPGGYGPELLQLGEEVLDQVACLVEVLVVGPGFFAVALGRDHRCLAGLRQRLEHSLVGVECLVGDQSVGSEFGQQGVGTLQIMCLPGREGQAGRVAQRIDRGVDLRAQAATAAPDRLVVGAVFLAAPALC